MSNTAETPTIIQPDVSANRVTNLRKRLFTWFAEQRLHCIVFIAYVTVTVTVSCFHEPWFDEAQAWLIARDCSWKELLTVRTHYEGHPPLWWMLLAIPAKLGMPYEIGLKSLNLMCAALMIWLLEFKTKLPELLKVILPFSYFLCYQYGVTSRPYALMIAAMLLIAINWNNRNTKPWPVILSMMLLCATSSYGLAIAGMLALNWTIQFLCGERSLIKNKQRFAGLVLLLVFAIILLLNVLPAPGTYHGDFDIHDCNSITRMGFRSQHLAGNAFRDVVHFNPVGWQYAVHRSHAKRAVYAVRNVMPDVVFSYSDLPTPENRIIAAHHILGYKRCVHRASFGNHLGILHRHSRHRLRYRKNQFQRLASVDP